MSLKSFSAILSLVRALVFDATAIVSVCAFAFLVGWELSRSTIVLEPIGVPGSIKALGITEEVAAHRLWDALTEVNEAANTAKEQEIYQPRSRELNIVAPGGGFSLSQFLAIVRRLFGLNEARIGGEFICAAAECDLTAYRLRLRVVGGEGTHVAAAGPIGAVTSGAIDAYFHRAAVRVMEILDPYTAAIYHLRRNDVAKAREIAKDLQAPFGDVTRWASNLLGIIATLDEDYEAAEEWYLTAVWQSRRAGATDFAQPHANLGFNLLTQNRCAEAMKHFAEGARVDPRFPNSHLGMAQCWDRLGAPAKAAARFAKTVRLDPDYARGWYEWGRFQFRRAQYADAARKFAEVVRIHPDHGEATFEWGTALLFLGDAMRQGGDEDGALRTYRSAMRKFGEAAEIDPLNARFHYNRGYVARRLGDGAAAVAAFEKAVWFDPDYADAHYLLGRAQSDLGRQAAAAAAFAIVLDLEPENARAFDRWLENVEAQAGGARPCETLDALQADLEQAASQTVWSDDRWARYAAMRAGRCRTQPRPVGAALIE